MKEWDQIRKTLDEEDPNLYCSQGDLAEDGTLTIRAANRFILDAIKQKYQDKLAGIAQTAWNRPVKQLKFLIDEQLAKEEKYEKQVEYKTRPKVLTRQAGLNPEYTFENFVVGESNRLAYEETTYIVENLGQSSSNPLFIYADVGLGKTHLIQAMANRIAKVYPTKKVIYISAQNFINHFFKAIAERTKEEFRERYRQNDVILIDDVQGLSGVTPAQEEFFGLFNDFFLSNRQIVLTSDRHPGKIPNIADRIISRFEGGSLSTIHPPERELRIAIIEKTLAEVKDRVSGGYIQIIANDIEKDIRRLKGAANRLKRLVLQGIPITSLLVEEIIETEKGKTADAGEKALHTKKIDQILQAVAQYFELTKEILLAKDKIPPHVHARDVAIYLLYEKVEGLSYAAIGRLLDREKSNISVSYHKIKSGQDKEGKQQVDEILKGLARI